MSYERPVDSEGRILLPEDVREELGIEAGTTVTIELEDEEVTITSGKSSYDMQRRGHGSPTQTNTSKPSSPPDSEES